MSTAKKPTPTRPKSTLAVNRRDSLDYSDLSHSKPSRPTTPSKPSSNVVLPSQKALAVETQEVLDYCREISDSLKEFKALIDQDKKLLNEIHYKKLIHAASREEYKKEVNRRVIYRLKLLRESSGWQTRSMNLNLRKRILLRRSRD